MKIIEEVLVLPAATNIANKLAAQELLLMHLLRVRFRQFNPLEEKGVVGYGPGAAS